MNALKIAGTEVTPAIILDPKNAIFEVSGRSLAENPDAVYLPMMDWLRAYAPHANETTLFSFKLEYFNTASAKALLDVLSLLSQIKNTTVLWYYPELEEYIKEAGEELFELVSIPFEFKSY